MIDDAVLDELVSLRDVITSHDETFETVKKMADAICELRTEVARLSAPVSSEIEAMAEKLDSLSYRFRRSGEDDDIAAPSATLLRALDRERQDFHMTYRMKCDAETKALQSALAAAHERVAELEREREARFILGMRAAAELVRGYGPARLDIIAAADKLERQMVGG